MSHLKNDEERIDHDGLFKELIQTFFEEFVILFFPNIYEEIDFTHVTFLDKEMVNDAQGRKKREVDIIVETRLKQEECLIIIHVELQASYESNFNERMFVYFSRLFEKYRKRIKRILPIALFSYAEKREEANTFEMNFPFLDVLKFQYLTIELNKLNWREFIRRDNPVAGALLSKMGYNDNEKIKVKKEFIQMLARMELYPAKQKYCLDFSKRIYD